LKALKIKSVFSVYAPIVYNYFAFELLGKILVKFLLSLTGNRIIIPTLAIPQRELETSIQPLKKLTVNPLLLILKSNTETCFQNGLNFLPSSPAYGTIYWITGCFLNALQAF
jgi:hypothetical protein